MDDTLVGEVIAGSNIDRFDMPSRSRIDPEPEARPVPPPLDRPLDVAMPGRPLDVAMPPTPESVSQYHHFQPALARHSDGLSCSNG